MRRARKGCLTPDEWTEWLDGAVDPLAAELYRRHVERCSACRDQYESLSLAVRALKESARDDALAVPVHGQVKRRLAWEMRYRLSHRRRRWWMPVAVSILAVGLGLMMMQPGLSEKARSLVDLYVEMHQRAEALATSDLSPLVAGRGELLR